MIKPITGKTDRTRSQAQVEAMSRRVRKTVQIAKPMLINHRTSMMRRTTSHVQTIFIVAPPQCKLLLIIYQPITNNLHRLGKCYNIRNNFQAGTVMINAQQISQKLQEQGIPFRTISHLAVFTAEQADRYV